MKLNLIAGLFVAFVALVGAGMGSATYNATYDINDTQSIIMDAIGTGGVKVVEKEPQAIDQIWNLVVIGLMLALVGMAFTLLMFPLLAVGTILAWALNLGNIRGKFGGKKF